MRETKHLEDLQEGEIPRSLSMRQWATIVFGMYFAGIGSMLFLVENDLTEAWEIEQLQDLPPGAGGCTEVWKLIHGGPGSDIANAIIASSDGGFLVLGHTSSFGEGQGLYIVKISDRRRVKWERTYQHIPSNTNLGSMAEAEDGGYLIAVNTEVSTGESERDVDIRLLRIDNRGKLAWSKTYGACGDGRNDWATACTATDDGGFVIVGSTTPEAGLPDLLVLKVDDEGKSIWEGSYGGEGNDGAYAIARAGDGFVIAGHTTSFGSENRDIYLLRLDANGKRMWERSYPTGTADIAKAIVSAGNGFILAGSSRSDGRESTDAYVLKVSAMGEQEWTESYGGPSWDEAFSIHPGTQGGYVLAGGTDRSFNQGESSVGIYVAKIDESGNLLWEYRYGGDCLPATTTPQAADGTFAAVSSIGGDIMVLKMQETG